MKTVIDMALEALELLCVKCRSNEWGPDTPRKEILNWMHNHASKAHTDIKEALAEPEEEPVAWEQFYPDIGKPQIALNAEVVGYVAPQPAQKPVAWMYHPFGDDEAEFEPHQECENCVPLYTTPPQRPWVGLTGQEKELIASVSFDAHDAVYRTDAKLKEKNT